MSLGGRRRPGPPRPLPPCREAALAALARRSHTRRELSLKLRRKGYAPDQVEATLSGLAERGWLDDRAAAAAVVASATSRGKGSGRIRAELAARGVAAEDAAAALAEVPAEDEEARLLAALAKRLRTLPPGLTRPARSKKLFDHLVRRGFAPDAVLRALREKGDAADDDL